MIIHGHSYAIHEVSTCGHKRSLFLLRNEHSRHFHGQRVSCPPPLSVYSLKSSLLLKPIETIKLEQRWFVVHQCIASLVERLSQSQPQPSLKLRAISVLREMVDLSNQLRQVLEVEEGLSLSSEGVHLSINNLFTTQSGAVRMEQLLLGLDYRDIKQRKISRNANILSDIKLLAFIYLRLRFPLLLRQNLSPKHLAEAVCPYEGLLMQLLLIDSNISWHEFKQRIVDNLGKASLSLIPAPASTAKIVTHGLSIGHGIQGTYQKMMTSCRKKNINSKRNSNNQSRNLTAKLDLDLQRSSQDDQGQSSKSNGRKQSGPRLSNKSIFVTQRGLQRSMRPSLSPLGVGRLSLYYSDRDHYPNKLSQTKSMTSANFQEIRKKVNQNVDIMKKTQLVRKKTEAKPGQERINNQAAPQSGSGTSDVPAIKLNFSDREPISHYGFYTSKSGFQKQPVKQQQQAHQDPTKHRPSEVPQQNTANVSHSNRSRNKFKSPRQVKRQRQPSRHQTSRNQVAMTDSRKQKSPNPNPKAESKTSSMSPQQSMPQSDQSSKTPESMGLGLAKGQFQVPAEEQEAIVQEMNKSLSKYQIVNKFLLNFQEKMRNKKMPYKVFQFFLAKFYLNVLNQFQKYVIENGDSIVVKGEFLCLSPYFKDFSSKIRTTISRHEKYCKELIPAAQAQNQKTKFSTARSIVMKTSDNFDEFFQKVMRKYQPQFKKYINQEKGLKQLYAQMLIVLIRLFELGEQRQLKSYDGRKPIDQFIAQHETELQVVIMMGKQDNDS